MMKLEEKEILYDGYFYDVTDFIKKHPGGNIIRYYTEPGEDSTIAFQQFHYRSIKRVKLMLNSFQKRPASYSEIGLDPLVLKKNRMLTEDFTKLYLELEREGHFKPSVWHIIFRIAELFVMGIVGYTLALTTNYFAKFVGVVLCGLLHGRCGFLTHETGHYSFSGNPKLDRFLDVCIYGLGLGLSSAWWRRQHNRHHAMPQRIYRDVDLDTMPLLAFNAKVAKNTKDGRGFFIQNQVYLFALIDTFLVGVLWRFYINPKFVLKRKLYFEAASIVLHFWIFSKFRFWNFFFTTWITSIYLFVNFSLNHTHLPVTTDPATHWMEYSLRYTANVEHTRWCNWWMGYLNYQIEHHLFPTIPHFRLPLIKERVKALAEKHNLPYIIYSYVDAVQITFKNLSNVSEELSLT